MAAFGPDGGPSQPAPAAPPPPPPSVGEAATPKTSGGGGGGGARSAGGGGPIPAAAPADPQAIRDRVRAEYPAYAFLVDHPEIGPLLIAAASGEIDEATFMARLQATNWWRQTSEAQRQWFALINTDPAQAEAQRQSRIAELNDVLGSMGAQGLFGGDLTALATQTLEFGLDAAQIRDLLVSGLTAGFGAIENLPVVAQMEQLAADWLVPLNDSDLDSYARRMLAGDTTLEGFTADLRALARGRFPHLQAQIDAGTSPGQFFAPYRNLIAQELEVTPEHIDLLGDSRWLNVMSVNDGGTIRPMTLSEAQTFARRQPGYTETRGGQRNASELAEFISQTFGAVR